MRPRTAGVCALFVAEALAVGLAVGSAVAQCQIAQIKAADGAEGDRFGWAVAISGDNALVGAYKDNDYGTGSGAAFVFQRNGLAWEQVVKLSDLNAGTADELTAGDEYGKAVAICGDIAVVGARRREESVALDCGAVYVYRRRSSVLWSAETVLHATDFATGDLFGDSVATDGDRIVASAVGKNEGQGAAYVFRYDPGDENRWVEEAKLVGSDSQPGDRFGTAVAIDGDSLVIGAIYVNAGAGAVYLFDFDSAAGWQEAQKLTAVDQGGNDDSDEHDSFGNSVALSGNRLAVGSKYNDDACPNLNYCNSGSVYVFRHAASAWAIESKLVASDAAQGDEFGRSVSLGDTWLLVGAYRGNDPGDVETGSAYLYHREGAQWREAVEFNGNQSADADRFGVSVALGGDYAIVGAYSNDDIGSTAGAGYLFRITLDDDCNNNGAPDACDILEGTSEDLNGNGIPDDCECELGDPCHESPDLDCTLDYCSADTSRCVHEVDPDYCAIQGACYANGEDNPLNECGECNAGVSQTCWTPKPYGSPCAADDLDCTADICDSFDATCVHTLVEGFCEIGGTCYAEGTLNPVAECQACDPMNDPHDWSGRPDGTPCTDDGLFCTGLETCQDEVCQSPGDPCVDQSLLCDETGDACVECLSDEDCDDGNECTDDVCDAGSCVFPYLPGGTSCGDPTDDDCTAPDICNGAGVCLDNHVPDETPCTDDGLFCTGIERCVTGVCQSSGNPCAEAGTACDEERDECAPDCNDNGVPDAQDITEGTSDDCNDNDLPDECETPGTSHAAVFGTGLFTPEGITPTQGDYPPGIFVAGYGSADDGAVYHVPPDGGEAAEFALQGCAALVFVPDEFGGAGTRLFVADAGTDVYEVGSDGSVTEFFNAFGSLLVPSGLDYAPRSVGGPVAGRLLVSGQGNGELHNEDPTLFAIDADGSAQRIAGLPEEPFSITLAPVHFGAFGHRLFIACASSRILYELNLHSLEMTQFMALPSGTYGLLRQITFSPVGWVAPLDEDLAEESVMLVSAGQFSSDGRGDVTVWDQRGRFVALMRPRPYGNRVNPRGMAFVGDDLFVSNLNDGTVIRATVDDFYVDCNLNGIPDECDLPDCNSNGVPDDCEPDCNENGIPDECDIAAGTSPDGDADGVPDECECLFVDAMATGANDGSNWVNAFTCLRDALAKAAVFGSGVEEIWVAAGTYRPELDEGHHVGQRSATFQLVNRVAMYGGFEGADSVSYPGGETSRDQRDPAANVTILSGDLDVNDGPDFTNIDENSLHVVTARCCGRSSVLDGFTITGGNADDLSWPLRTDFGAGMYNLGSNLTVANCTFRYNSVIGCGAGMYNDGLSNPTLVNCVFHRNYADSQWTNGIGGGIGSGAGSGPTLTDCTFTENHADHTGGGMAGAGNPTLTNCQFSNNTAGENGGGLACAGAPMLTDCSFTGNVAGTEGGGMDQCDGGATLSGCVFAGNWADVGAGIACEGSSQLSDCTFSGNTASEEGGAVAQWGGSPTLTDCTFAANLAVYGGGLVNRDSSPTLTDCTFLGNSAVEHGGGIAGFDMSNLTLANCTLKGNQAGGSGGGLVSKESDATLLNCTFDGNLANRVGGGVYNRDGSGAVVHSCTFAGNSASNGPAVACDSLHLQYPNDLEMTDCILWDGGNEVWNNDGSAITITYSDVQGGWTGTGNIDEDPRFVPGPAGCYYLGQISAGQTLDSPCVDTGSDTAANLELDTLTTRSDEGVDTGIADMGYHYPVTGQPLVMGDYDRDLDVDLADFAAFQSCFTGSEPLEVSPCCRIFDFEHDGDIDLDDYAALEPVLTGG